METPQTDESFETLMARLAGVVERLEQGELPLADALALYEEGMALGHACEQHLQAVSLHVEELTTDADGTTLRPWEPR